MLPPLQAPTTVIQKISAISKELNQTPAPTLIVADRELATMNAIRVVFPRTANLLCIWYINKNIFANCLKFFPSMTTTGWKKSGVLS